MIKRYIVTNDQDNFDDQSIRLCDRTFQLNLSIMEAFAIGHVRIEDRSVELDDRTFHLLPIKRLSL